MLMLVYTDGGSRGNPGPASCAFVVTDDQDNPLHEASTFLGTQTNNVAEYNGIINALQWLNDQAQHDNKVTIHMDSLLIVSQLNGQYKVKDAKMQQLFAQSQQLIRSLRQQQVSLSITYVPRAQNARADALVNECLDKSTRESLS